MRGKIFPYAGGVLDELSHNRKYVLAIYMPGSTSGTMMGRGRRVAEMNLWGGIVRTRTGRMCMVDLTGTRRRLRVAGIEPFTPICNIQTLTPLTKRRRECATPHFAIFRQQSLPIFDSLHQFPCT